MGRGPIEARMTNDSYRLRLELQEAQAKLRKAHERIAWMEASRFWKIRNQWFRLKTLFKPKGRDAERASGIISPRSASVLAEWIDETPLRPVSELTRSPKRVDVVVVGRGPWSLLESCLERVVRFSRPGDSLLVLDCGLDPQEAPAVAAYVTSQRGRFVEAREGRGSGPFPGFLLEETGADFVAFVASAAMVTPDWLDRLIACAESGGRIGVAVPLSGLCASSAGALLPGNEGLDSFATLVSGASGRIYPRVSAFSSPCVLIRARAPVDVIAEDNEHPYRIVLRQGEAALADNLYIGSGGHPERIFSIEKNANGLNSRTENSGQVVEVILERAARLSVSSERRRAGRNLFEGKRILFVLPVIERGGGANIVLREARALVAMGVDAQVLNLPEHRQDFERNYPDPGVPVIFACPEEITTLGSEFDAVVATANHSVEWLVPLSEQATPPVLGYYVQDFEPFFYPMGSSGHDRAWHSYGLIPGMRLFTKTEWNRAEVEGAHSVPCRVVGASFDSDLFRPRIERPTDSVVRIAAMVRPSTPRRQPELTMELLAALYERKLGRVEIILFGAEGEDPNFLKLTRQFAFPFRNGGILSEAELAVLFNHIDVFADFSSFQAMGLTALEAMGCGAAVIVPTKGGTSSFARSESNALVVDTGSRTECLAALERLVDDESLRVKLGRQAALDVLDHDPERAAFRILEALFGDA